MTEGSAAGDMDFDEPESNVKDTINLDPFEFVYSNMPDSTHIL
jgi:hypothetical protein